MNKMNKMYKMNHPIKILKQVGKNVWVFFFGQL